MFSGSLFHILKAQGKKYKNTFFLAFRRVLKWSFQSVKEESNLIEQFQIWYEKSSTVVKLLVLISHSYISHARHIYFYVPSFKYL